MKMISTRIRLLFLLLFSLLVVFGLYQLCRLEHDRMARGAPDYSNVKVPGLVGRLDDMGELAIRLGGVSSIDRLGDISVIEDFKYGASLVTTSDAGLGEVQEISSLYSRQGGYTLRLYRIANANSYSGVTVRSAMRDESRIGGEVIFVTTLGHANYKLYISRYTGTQRILWGLRWDGTSEKVYIGSDTDGWTETSDLITPHTNYPVQTSMKLVVDEGSQEYIRAMVAGRVITIPDKDCTIGGDTSTAKTVLDFYNAIGPVLASNVYIDTIIITHNEP